MAGDEDQPQQVVADLVVERVRVESGAASGLALASSRPSSRVLARRASGAGAAGRSPGAWPWPSARRPACRARPRPASAPAPRPARPAPAPRPGPRRAPCRASPAISRARSIFQTAWMAPWVDEVVTAADQTSGGPPAQAAARLSASASTIQEHAEPVGHHAEAGREEGGRQRHPHLPALGQGREQSRAVAASGTAQRQREALEAGLAAAPAVRGQEARRRRSSGSRASPCPRRPAARIPGGSGSGLSR